MMNKKKKKKKKYIYTTTERWTYIHASADGKIDFFCQISPCAISIFVKHTTK